MPSEPSTLQKLYNIELLRTATVSKNILVSDLVVLCSLLAVLQCLTACPFIEFINNPKVHKFENHIFSTAFFMNQKGLNIIARSTNILQLKSIRLSLSPFFFQKIYYFLYFANQICVPNSWYLSALSQQGHSTRSDNTNLTKKLKINFNLKISLFGILYPWKSL